MVAETKLPATMATIQSPLPRITIQFCTQCKWMLRAAYFAQELLSTFNTALGEVALQPSTGGTFVVEIFHEVAGSVDSDEGVQTQRAVLWDRKVEGGFPETKELKRRVRDIIQPGRDLGHVDGKKKTSPPQESGNDTRDANITSSSQLEIKPSEKRSSNSEGEGDGVKRNADGSVCEDCN